MRARDKREAGSKGDLRTRALKTIEVKKKTEEKGLAENKRTT